MVGGGAVALGGMAGPLVTVTGAQAQAYDWEITPFDMTLGDENAPITMIEYASLTCPHCATFHNTTLPSLKTDFIDTGEVFFVYRDFPLDRVALAASMIARCIGGSAYFPALNALFAQQSTWASANNPLDAMFQVVQPVGMTRDDFDACLTDRDLAESIVEVYREGIQRYNVQATPSFLVDGEMHSGAQPLSYWREVFNDSQT